MFTLSFSVDTSEVDKALSAFERSVRDLTPVWVRVAAVFYRDLQRRFDTGGSNAGDAWLPLSDAYRSWKLKHYPQEQIGTLTGDLRRSVISNMNANSIFRPFRQTLVIGTSVKHAGYFDKRRPVYVISSEAQDDAQTVIYEWLCSQASEAGFKVQK